MRQLHVGIAVIRRGNTYVFQLRSDDPAKGAAGLIGGFGGKLEPGESAEVAVCRELGEETSLQPLVDDLLYIGATEVLSDHQLQEVKIKATFFRLTIDETIEIVAHEGKVIYMTEEEVYANLHRLTPATRAYFETVIMRNEHVPANRS